MLKSTLQQTDPEIYNIIQEEAERQEYGIELIASENYTSKAVMEAMGSVLTNKYSEGYVGKRYYGGNEVIDKMEALAIERCKKLFGCDHVNIQPLSGSPANAAVYFAVLKPGDKVLGLKLDHGGHLSHGHPVNFSGMLYNFVQYEVDKETGRIDMDKVREIALREKPKMILAGFSAYSRNLDWKRFKEIADEVGALTMADISHVAGLIAGKAIDSPVPYFDIVTTTTHKTLRGPRSAIIMCKDRTIQKMVKGELKEVSLAKEIDKGVRFYSCALRTVADRPERTLRAPPLHFGRRPPQSNCPPVAVPRPDPGRGVRPPARGGQYSKGGSTRAGARASKPPAYPLRPVPTANAKLQ